jgi:hypothetical protein
MLTNVGVHQSLYSAYLHQEKDTSAGHTTTTATTISRIIITTIIWWARYLISCPEDIVQNVRLKTLQLSHYSSLCKNVRASKRSLPVQVQDTICIRVDSWLSWGIGLKGIQHKTFDLGLVHIHSISQV